jgi:hypothetical protein
MNGIVGTRSEGARRDFFYLDGGFHMKQRTWNGSEWVVNWIELGGIFTSVPAVVSTMARQPLVVSPGVGDVAADAAVNVPAPPVADAPTIHVGPHGPVGGELLTHRIDVFGLGLDYAMYHKVLWGEAHASPGPWESLGGVFTSAPAAIWLNGRLHVFGLGSDLSMWWRTWDGQAWSPAWERLGGFFSSTPVLVSWGPHRLDVFARGADFTLRHRLFENGAWTGDWQNLGGSLASAPAAVSWGADRLDVFAIGNEQGDLLHRWWDGDIWNDWEHIAGKPVGDEIAFTSAPAAAASALGHLDVLAVAGDGTLYHVRYADHAWSDPQALAPTWKMRSTPMLLATAPNQLEVIAPGRDHNMYRKTWTGAAWEPLGWQQLGDHMRLPSQFRISIDLIRCNRPRSLNNDTVTGQCTLKIGNWPNAVDVPAWPLAPITQGQGDLGNTAIDEGQTNLMHFDPVTIELHESAAFNYTFANTNQPEPEVVAALQEQGLKLADFAVKSAVDAAVAGVGLSAVQVGSLAAPITGSLVALLTSWLIGELHSIFGDKCDGVVAIENYVRRGDELQRMVSGGQPVRMAVLHKGTDSPATCGAKSEYVVTWSIRQSTV